MACGIAVLVLQEQLHERLLLQNVLRGFPQVV